MINVKMNIDDKVTFCKLLSKASDTSSSYYASDSQETYSGDHSCLLSIANFKAGIQLSACIIILLGGLLGNVTVILIVALKKAMRTTFNFYVVNLAVADAGMCIVGVMDFASLELTNNVNRGDFMCKFGLFFQYMCTLNSGMTLAVISRNRFMGVMFPLRDRATKQHPCVVITILWILSIALAVPFYFTVKYTVTEETNCWLPTCDVDLPMDWYYDESLGECVLRLLPNFLFIYAGCFHVIIFLSLFIVVIANLIILWKVWTVKAPGEQQEADANQDSRTRKKVSVMIFLVLLVLIIGWIPSTVMILHIILFAKFTVKSAYEESWLIDFQWSTIFFFYAHSFMNPIIYGALKKDFKQEFSSILRCVYLRNRWRKSGATRNRPPNRPVQTLEGANKTDPRAIGMEMQIRKSSCEGNSSPAMKDTCIPIEDVKEMQTFN